MPRRFATSSAHFFSCGSSAERNLLAHLSMGPSIVTSTVSLALAESFSTSGGILKSWARAATGSVASAIHNSVFRIVLLLHLVVLSIVHTNVVYLRFRELQLAAGYPKSK